MTGFDGTSNPSNSSGPNASGSVTPTSDENGDVNGWQGTVNLDTDGDGDPDWDASADTNGNYSAGYTFDNGTRVGVYSGGDGNSGGVTITIPLGN
ncbi:MAG: hypothetical protein AAF296_06610 [Pseudomonadota bacterium]